MTHRLEIMQRISKFDRLKIAEHLNERIIGLSLGDKQSINLGKYAFV